LQITDTHPLLLDNLAKAQTTPDKWLDSTVHLMPGAGVLGSREHPFRYDRAIDLYNSWVYAAINLNATAIASLPLKLFAKRRSTTKLCETRAASRRTLAYLNGDQQHSAIGAIRPHRDTMRKISDLGGDFVEVIGSHPLMSVLHDANYWYNGFDLMQLLVIYLECTGNAYWHPIIDPVLQVPNAIWPMPTQWVRVVPSDDNFVEGYAYGRTRMDAQEFDVDEVIHFRTANPSDQGVFYGMGKIEAGWKAVLLNDSRQTMDLALADNQARPDYLMVAKQGTTRESLDRFEAAVDKKLRGKSKTGRFLSMTGDIELKPLQWPPSDLTGRSEIVEEIAAVFGVPVSLLKANDPNLASAQVGYAAWKSNTIAPLAALIEQKLNERLVPLFGLEGEAVLAFDNPVPEDRQFEMAESTARLSNGTRTINEDRELRGEEPVEGGSEPRIGGQSLAKLDADAPAFEVPGFRIRPQDDIEQAATTPDQTFTVGTEIGKMANAINHLVHENAKIQAALTRMQDEQQKRRPTEPSDTPADGSAAQNNATQNPARGSGADRGEADGRTQRRNSRTSDRAGDGKVERRPGEAVGACVERGVAILIDEGMDADQAVAAAADMCGDPKHAEPISHRAIVWSKAADDVGDAEDDAREGEPDAPHLELAAALGQLLEAQRQAVTALIEQQTPKAMKRRKQLPAALKRELDRIIVGLEPEFAVQVERAITSMIQASGSAAIHRLGVDIDFDVTSPAVVEFLRGYAIDLAGNISQSTLAVVTQTIDDGLTQGLPPGDIATRVMDTGEFAAGRAEAIARSETARAYVAGEEQGWQQSGVVEGKKWLLAPNACEFCKAIAAKVNSKVTPLDGSFIEKGPDVFLTGSEGGRLNINYTDIKGPPLHPNCRCDIQAVLKD